MGVGISLLVSLFISIALILLAYVGVDKLGLHSLFGVYIPYAALAIFIVGIILRVFKWARSPVPFRIPTTAGQEKSLPWIKHDKLEAPATTSQVVARMFLEVFLFRSL